MKYRIGSVYRIGRHKFGGGYSYHKVKLIEFVHAVSHMPDHYIFKFEEEEKPLCISIHELRYIPIIFDLYHTVREALSK